MAHPQFECRVLSGLHQGARATLAPELEKHSVSRDMSADLVLRDLPIGEGQIVLRDDSWQWSDSEFETTLAMGESLDLGGVVIQVCTSELPWPESPDAPATLVRQSAPPMESALTDPMETGNTRQPAASEEQDLSLQSMRPMINDERLGAKPLAWKAALGISAALFVGLSGAVVWNVLESGNNDDPEAQTQAAAAESARLAASLEADFNAIETLISERDISDRVEASLNASSGRIEILGVMADDQEFEDFVRAVRKITSRVALRITTHRDFSTDAIGLQQDLPEGIQITTKPIGILTVKGTVNDDQERDNLVSKIENLVPMAAEIDIQLKTKAEVSKENRKRPGGDTASSLPKIMSVVGGPEPFLVLPNGDRIMIGGQINGMTLSTITNTHIEYVNADGKIVRVQR